jgi:hypothetical protein
MERHTLQAAAMIDRYHWGMLHMSLLFNSPELSDTQKFLMAAAILATLHWAPYVTRYITRRVRRAARSAWNKLHDAFHGTKGFSGS